MGWSFGLGLAEGLATSVTEGIKKEQESMEEMFQTQFKTRLRRREDDLVEHRKNLQEAAKHLESYAGFTGGNKHQAAQLYKAAGGNHPKFLERLSNYQLSTGKDAMDAFKFTEENYLDPETSYTDIARSFVTAPEALPIADMPKQKGMTGMLREAFGIEGDSQADRLKSKLEAITPMPEAGKDLGISGAKMTGTLRTAEEQANLAASQAQTASVNLKMKHSKALFPYLKDKTKAEASSARTAAEIAKDTMKDTIAYKESQAAKAAADAARARWGSTDSILELEKKKMEQEIEKLDVQIDTLKNPADLKDAKGRLVHQIYNIKEDMSKYRPGDPKHTELKALHDRFLKKEVAIDAALGEEAARSAPAGSPHKGLAALNTGYHKMLASNIANSTMEKGKITFVPVGDQIVPQFTGTDKKAKRHFNRIVYSAQKAFFMSQVKGADSDGNPTFISSASQQSLILNTSTNFARLKNNYKISQTRPKASDYLADIYKVDSYTNKRYRSKKGGGSKKGGVARQNLIDQLVDIYNTDSATAKRALEAHENEIANPPMGNT